MSNLQPKRSTMPPNSRILEYWSGTDYFKTKELSIYYPSCWACKWDGLKNSPFSESEIDDHLETIDTFRDNLLAPKDLEKFLKSTDAITQKIKATWDKANFLERCHIIPRSLGGSDNPENLFLLCRECHDDAPDITSKKFFLMWAEKTPHCVSTFFKRLDELCALYLPTTEIEQLGKTISSKEFNEWLKKNAGIHTIRRKNWSKPSTIIFAALHFTEIKVVEGQAEEEVSPTMIP